MPAALALPGHQDLPLGSAAVGGYVVAMGGLGNADWCGCGGEWALSA